MVESEPYLCLTFLQTELYEIQQDLKAVHNMNYIGNSQLHKLERTIVNETGSLNPQIRTKSTRSVSQLAQRFENRIQHGTQVGQSQRDVKLLLASLTMKKIYLI